MVYSILDAVYAMPEHLVTSQHAGSVPTLATSAKWSRSEDNTLARDPKGEIYAVVGGSRKNHAPGQESADVRKVGRRT